MKQLSPRRFILKDGPLYPKQSTKQRNNNMNEDTNVLCLEENPTISEPEELVYIANSSLIPTAIRIAKKFIKPQEGLSLRAYPDPDSPMGKALTTHGVAKLYQEGKYILPESFLELSPEPVTIGYGCTEKGLKLGTEWTLEQAESALDAQLAVRIKDILKAAPSLYKHSPEKLAACLSLQYNIGKDAFNTSSLVRCLNENDMIGAVKEFPKWNKDNGHIVQGLVNRRAAEVALFNSVKE